MIRRGRFDDLDLLTNLSAEFNEVDGHAHDDALGAVPLLAGSRFFVPTWRANIHGTKNLDQTDRRLGRSRGVRELPTHSFLTSAAGSSRFFSRRTGPVQAIRPPVGSLITPLARPDGRAVPPQAGGQKPRVLSLLSHSKVARSPLWAIEGVRELPTHPFLKPSPVRLETPSTV
jgi:hypothetical protein